MILMGKYSDQLLCWLLICILKIVIIAALDNINNNNEVIYNSQIRNVRASKENICTRYCKCDTENTFSTANCDLLNNQEYKFSSDLEIPQTVTRLNIHLGPKVSFQLVESIFDNNKINHIAINGTFSLQKQSSSSKVDISRNAFRGLNAPLPEIILRNLQTVVLRDFAFTQIGNRGEFILTINEVEDVIVQSKVFQSTTFHANFGSISNLQLNENSFSGSTSSKVAINKTFIRELMKINASLKELKIENSGVNIIKRNAIDVYALDSFILKNCKIDHIESDAITEKVLAKHVAVIDCDIKTFEAKAFNGFGTEKFTFEKNRVFRINDHALNFVGVDVSLSHNKINNLEKNWFKCKDWSNITISNNTFGDFHHMYIDNSSNVARSCLFHHNLMTITSDDSFRTIKKQCQMTELIFYKECNCDFESWLKKIFIDSPQSINSLKQQSNCRIDSTLKLCFKSEIIKFKQYFERICGSNTQALDCKKPIEKKNGTFIRPHELSENEGWQQYMYHIIAGIGCIVILIITSMGFIACRNNVICYKDRENENDQYITNVTDPHLQTMASNQLPPSYHSSMRSIKTFSNKDHLIIKRTLEKMKEKQPADKYETVYDNTKRLLNETLNEYEKVRIIGDIVQVIGECENSGEDFVAFTDILYKHLAPDTRENVTQVPQPIQLEQDNHEIVYSEPVLHHQQPDQTVDPKLPKLHEHIYAEPANLMQQQTMMPLLTNNYSSPLDDNDVNTNEYSEPIQITNNFRPTIPVSPYAISEDMQQPSTSKNLPDILNRDKQFEPGPSEINRITRSPTTNRKIPEYTVPSHHNKKPFKITQENIEDWSDESLQESTSSNHSGGSGATVKMDDLMLYADTEKK